MAFAVNRFSNRVKDFLANIQEPVAEKGKTKPQFIHRVFLLSQQLCATRTPEHGMYSTLTYLIAHASNVSYFLPLSPSQGRK